MKHNPFLQIFSVAMAVLVLVSTLSVSIEKHYCGEHLVDVAIFTQADDCGMEAADMDVKTSGEEAVSMAKSCCKNVLDVYEGQDELSLEKTKELNTNQKVIVLALATVFSGVDLFGLQNNPPFDHYTPPLVVEDIQVLNEVFLI